MTKPKPVWLATLIRPNQRARALVHRVDRRIDMTLCGKQVPAPPNLFVGQSTEVQCPSCQARQKRL